MITTQTFVKPCGCRTKAECPHNSFVEIEALDALVDAFAMRMKAKLRQKALAGYTGWDDPTLRPGILASLRLHVGKGEMIDVANIAAMLWNMEQP